jgi:hypothetical protein
MHLELYTVSNSLPAALSMAEGVAWETRELVTLV